MKNIILTILMLLFIPFLTFPQVGIGTTNPTKTLDIDGELRIRETPEILSNKFLVVDSIGNVGYTISLSSVTFSYDKKYAIRTSTPNGNSIYVRNTNTDGIYVTGANHPYVELNLSIDVEIPTNTKSIITIDYFVPLGVMGQHTQVNGYLGTTFFKNDLRLPEGDRKFNLNQMFKINNQSNHAQINMSSVNAQYVEIVINDTPSVITNTFEVKGYIEQAYANQNTTYRFNNWESWYNMNSPYFANNNRNWGVGYISYYILNIPL